MVAIREANLLEYVIFNINVYDGIVAADCSRKLGKIVGFWLLFPFWLATQYPFEKS